MAEYSKTKSIMTTAILCVMLTTEVASCPQKCTCYGTRVSCRFAGLDQVPNGIPSDTTFLDLTNNRLQTVYQASFSELMELTDLNLANNRIKFINPGSFYRNRKLQVLRLSNNHLTYLNFTTFSGLIELRILTITGNRLNSIHRHTFLRLGKLKRLDLNNNNIKCTCDYVKMAQQIRSRRVNINAQCWSDRRVRNVFDGDIDNRYCPTGGRDAFEGIVGAAIVAFFLLTFCFCCRGGNRGNFFPRRRRNRHPDPPPQGSDTPPPQHSTTPPSQRSTTPPSPAPETSSAQYEPNLPEYSKFTALSDAPPSYQSIVSVGTVEGGIAYNNPVFSDEDLPPPPSYDEVTGVPPAEALQEICGKVYQIQSVNHPTRMMRYRDSEVWLDEQEDSDFFKEYSTFTVVAGLAGKGISFQSLSYPDCYLRHRGGSCYVDVNDGTQLFNNDASFMLNLGLSATSTLPSISFESVNYPGYFITHTDFNVQITQFADTDQYRQDASWFPSPYNGYVES